MATLAIGAAVYLPPTDRTNTPGTPGIAADPAATAAAEAQAAALAELDKATMVKMAELLIDVNRDLSAGALSLPVVSSPGAMGNLSTADLLQVIRTEARKTASALIQATAEMVESQKLSIKAKSDGKIAKLNECIAKMEEAEKKRKEMEAIKIGMYILGGLICVACLIGAVFTGGATIAVGLAVMAGISAALLATTICLTEIKDDKGLSTMDRGIRDMATSMQKDYSSKYPDTEEGRADAEKDAGSIMMAIQIAIMVAMCIATLGMAAPAAAGAGAAVATAAVTAEVAKATTRTVMEVIKETVKAVLKAIIDAIKAMGKAVVDQVKSMSKSIGDAVDTLGDSAAMVSKASAYGGKTAGVEMAGAIAKDALMAVAKGSLQAVKNSFSSVSATANTVGGAAKVTEGALGIVQGENQMELAETEHDVATGKAEVEKLKALIKMLEALLEGDMAFIKMLTELQAKLDSGVAGIVRNEHDLNMQIEGDKNFSFS